MFLQKKVKPKGEPALVAHGANGGNDGDSRARGRLPLYPWNKSIITSQSKKGEFRASLRKCSCQSVWCPRCFKRRSLSKIVERLRGFDYRRVRHVVLTVKREIFGSAKEACDFVRSNRLIANLIWNLRRTVGVGVNDWLWMLEFHVDGWPHWHVILEVENTGRAGMIGGDVLRKYWLDGSMVFEWYVKNGEHWDNILGYLGTAGYFGESKDHQIMLPEWALNEINKIRRWGSKVGKVVHKVIEGVKGTSRGVRKMRAYRVILESCGKSTWVQIDADFFNEGGGVFARIDVEYAWLRSNLNGEYKQGLGYVAELTYDEVVTFLKCHKELYGLSVKLEDRLVKNPDFCLCL